VHAASGFSARIRVARGEREMDGKSIMGLLLLAAAQGCLITISASSGEQALAALCSSRVDEVAPCAGPGVLQARRQRRSSKRGTRDLRCVRPGSWN
jgi:phosphocarrier protein